MKIKRMIAAMMSVFVMAGCAMSVSAAEDASTFDYRAYANIYPDLKAAYGYDADKLYAHYVNYGQAEGRVGSFLAAPNPKNAPVYSPAAPETATGSWRSDRPVIVVPATLLDPIPPTEVRRQPAWKTDETTAIEYMSNAKLVAEYISIRDCLDQAVAAYNVVNAPGSTVYDPCVRWNNDPVEVREETLFEELRARYEAVEEAGSPDGEWYDSDAYQRAILSDTRILSQYMNRYEDLSAPPADPFTPPASAVPVTP